MAAVVSRHPARQWARTVLQPTPRLPLVQMASKARPQPLLTVCLLSACFPHKSSDGVLCLLHNLLTSCRQYAFLLHVLLTISQVCLLTAHLTHNFQWAGKPVDMQFKCRYIQLLAQALMQQVHVLFC